jgi:hypothetical protein
MEIAHQTNVASDQARSLQARSFDVTIILGYAILSVVFLIAIYLASPTSGTSSEDLLTMTVLP